jgi:hypothetical protein
MPQPKRTNNTNSTKSPHAATRRHSLRVVVGLLGFVASAALLSACSTIPKVVGTQSSAAAQQLLAATQKAHGGDAFAKIQDIAVDFDGEWATVVPKLQPILTDVQFRKTSQERLLLTQNVTAQKHSGPGGDKVVLKQGGQVSVVYNGKQDGTTAQRASSHLVMEAYKLFLMPAFYVQRAALLELAGSDTVDGHACDLLVAVLRPGFGDSAEDRAMLYVDQKTKLVRRVRLTLEGFEGTRGAVVDTTYLAYQQVAGVTWPTHLFEDLVSPFRGLAAHDFWITGLDVNRGMTTGDFTRTGFSQRAAKAATLLPKPAR